MERDTEGSRYYDHARSHEFNLGRFLGPDKLRSHFRDPQSWNRYTYARNNPMKLLDPNGKYFILATEQDRQQFTQALSVASRDSKARGEILALAGSSRPVLLVKGLTRGQSESVDPKVTGPREFGDTLPLEGGYRTPAQGAIVTIDFAKISAMSSRSGGQLDPAGVVITTHELDHAYAEFTEGHAAAVRQDDTGSSQAFGEQAYFAPDDPAGQLSECTVNQLILSPSGQTSNACADTGGGDGKGGPCIP